MPAMSEVMRPSRPAKLRAGDRVAIVSPSWAGPGVFPQVHDIALAYLRSEYGVEPVEYPTTRHVGARPEERAADLMAAFADPSIRAVMASIGGSDQITLLRHLDPAVFRADPKAFFGYSDNTNLLNWLWNLGIASYHGGSTLVHLARPGGVHPVFRESLRRALFEAGPASIEPVSRYTDLQCDWADLSTLETPLETFADEGYRGCVLLLETSEDMPSGEEVFHMLRDAGERGLLEQFPAVVVARAKAWSTAKPLGAAERAVYRAEQRAAVLRALDDYNPSVMVVFGTDFGHTDPQYVVPYGGEITIDGPSRTITAVY